MREIHSFWATFLCGVVKLVLFKLNKLITIFHIYLLCSSGLKKSVCLAMKMLKVL